MLLNFLSLRGAFGTYDDAVFGLALIAIMLLAERGRLPAAGDALRRVAGLARRRSAR